MFDVISVRRVCVHNIFVDFQIHDDVKMELDCQNLDSEFGLFGYKEEQKNTPDRPGLFLCLAAVAVCFKTCIKFHIFDDILSL